MSRGLSKNQQKILEILKEKKEAYCFHRDLENGWISCTDLIHYLKYGMDCFENNKFLEFKFSESEKQSYWRTIRLLKKRNYIKSEIKPVSKWKHNVGRIKFIKLNV